MISVGFKYAQYYIYIGNKVPDCQGCVLYSLAGCCRSSYNIQSTLDMTDPIPTYDAHSTPKRAGNLTDPVLVWDLHQI